MANRDIFEELKGIVHCEYISDLRYSPWLEQARMAIAAMDLSEFSLFVLNDAAEYLYGEKPTFASCADAQEYFRRKRHCAG